MPAPTSGLVLFWNCETLLAGKMDDLSDTGNDGTLSSTADRAVGQVGKARGFGGVDKIKADSAPSMSSYTICIWAKPAVDGKLCVAIDGTGAKYMHYGIITANKFGYTHKSGATAGLILEAGSTNATGAYVHIAARYNGHTVYFFRNGETQASLAATGTFTISGFGIGRWDDGTSSWFGDLDELRVYNRALPRSEIQDVYNDATIYPVTAVLRRPIEHRPALFPGREPPRKGL